MSPGPAELLAGLAAFRDVAPAQLARIAAASASVRLDGGEWLFRRGERASGFYAVERGSVKVAFLSPQGDEKVVEIAHAGQSFGEPLAFIDQPCPVSARALGASVLVHVRGQVLAAELARDPRLACSLLAGLSRRLQELLRDAGSDALRSGGERLADYLLENARGPAEILLPRKGALASRLSMTPEHFSRILHKLAGLGFIEVTGRRVHLRDPVQLRAWRG